MTGEQEEWETGKKSLSDCRVVLKGLGKAHGVSSSHSYLPKESHDVQEWAITSTLTVLSQCQGAALGKHGLSVNVAVNPEG